MKRGNATAKKTMPVKKAMPVKKNNASQTPTKESLATDHKYEHKISCINKLAQKKTFLNDMNLQKKSVKKVVLIPF